MDPLRLFLRMARIARSRPPVWKLLAWGAILALGLGLWSVEHWIGWPDWATLPRLKTP